MARTCIEFPGIEWVEGTGDFIRIDGEKCIGCADCIRVCLVECFTIVEKKAKITGLEKCMECGACWYVCTYDAIQFSWPRGGTGFRTSWG